MSYDRQIDQVCPHVVIDEAVFVDPSRQVVRPIKPIATLDSITMRINGLLDIPSQGVYLPVNVQGYGIGPFNIVKGVNDTLVVKVDQGPPQTVIIPAAAG